MDPDLVRRLCDGSFEGTLRIQTFESLWLHMVVTVGVDGIWPTDVDYMDHADDWCIWTLTRSNRGVPWYHIWHEYQHQRCNWQCNLSDSKKVILWHKGADDWESWKFEAGTTGVCIKNMASDLYLAAEPRNHAVHLIANRSDPLSGGADSWCNFRCQ